MWVGGVAEVTAILLAAYFAKNSLFPRVKRTHKMLTHTNPLLSVSAQPQLQKQPWVKEGNKPE